MVDTIEYKNTLELYDIISNIEDMQDKLLDIYSTDCKQCIKLLKDLSLLKEQAKKLHKEFENSLIN